MAWVLATSVTVSQFLDGTLVSRTVAKLNLNSFIVFLFVFIDVKIDIHFI